MHACGSFAPGTLSAMPRLVKFSGATSQDANADAHAYAETERKRALFVWAEEVLRQVGIADAIAAARSIEELWRIVLDVEAAEIVLAIRDALHPANGQRQEHFRGLREGALKGILKNRFAEAKRDRESELRHGREPSWTDELVRTKTGAISACLANLILFLKEHPRWKGVLGYNDFASQVVVRQHPPWGDEPFDAPWQDRHDTATRVWFQRQDINPSAADVGRAVQATARDNSVHPVREYLGALVWDGRPRLDGWLVVYTGAEDTPYIRAIGPRFLISAVARIYEPGCQADHVLVLEGPQGKLKSRLLRTLAVRDAWFTDRISALSSKDSAIDAAGVWIVELAEMDAITKASPSAMKAFITRPFDRFRPPYGKHLVNLKRQCVFTGTINPPKENCDRYLKDPTGSRRIWPVACHGMLDRDGFERDRDQLWAEAVHRYKAGAKWHLENPALEALAAAEQEKRFVVDLWEDDVREWLGYRLDTSVEEVLQHALNIDPTQRTGTPGARVAKILVRLGFTKQRPRTSKGRENRYRRESCSAKS
jgi:predicted P-loop ATPase